MKGALVPTESGAKSAAKRWATGTVKNKKLFVMDENMENRSVADFIGAGARWRLKWIREQTPS